MGFKDEMVAKVKMAEEEIPVVIPVLQESPKEEKEEETSPFKNLRGKKLFNENGVPVRAAGVYLFPKNEEELEMVKYYASIGHVEIIK